MKVMAVIFLAWQCQSSPTTIHQSQLVLAEPSVHCSLEYTTTWLTDYKELETEECETEYKSVCVTETNVVCVDSVITQCDTVSTTKCHTEYNTVCTDHTRYVSQQSLWSDDPPQAGAGALHRDGVPGAAQDGV